MSALTEFTVPAKAVALEETFREEPTLRVELVRTVTCDGELSLLWGSGISADAATAALEADGAVDSVTRLSHDGPKRTLYTVDWIEDPALLLESLAVDGGVLEAAASRGRWHITTVHPDHDSLTTAYQSCDVPIKVRSVRDLSEGVAQATEPLTESQREALLSALDHKFYDIPREGTLADLANDLGISHQAVSERLRRSHRKLALEALQETGEHEE